MTTPKTITLELELDQINIILEALGAMPFAKVYELIHTIQEQAQRQLEAEPKTPTND